MHSSCQLAGLFLLLFAPWAQAQECYKVAPGNVCTATAGGCTPFPTSLYKLDEFLKDPAEGWTRAPGRCGATSLGKACGNYLSGDTCAAGWPDPCECGPGIGPCEMSMIQAAAIAGKGPSLEASEADAVRSRLVRAARSVEGGSLGALWRPYVSLRSVHLRASIEVWQAGTKPDGNERRGNASYEYWEDGDRYRISSRTPNQLDIFSLEEIAFDGSVFQLFFKGGTLTVGSQDSRVALTYRNPFVLPIEFLNPSDALVCPACEIRLSDLKRLSNEVASSSRVIQGSHSLNTVEGGSVDDAPTTYIAQASSVPSELTSIEQKRQGAVVSRITFSDYRLIDKRSGWRFPWTIRLEMMDPLEEKVMAVFLYRIESLDLNSNIDRSIFTLPWSMAQLVWDEERHTFVHSAASHKPRGNGKPTPDGEQH